MSFTSLSFFLFLPAVFCLYWLLQRHLRCQNLLLVVASYVFYGYWDWRFLPLIALTTAASFLSGILIERFDARPRLRRAVAAANIILNLGILGLFKYFNFFAQSFADLLALCGLHADVPTLALILPVGISFYTFQALSYTIDVLRRQLPATRDAVAFFAYISFFPQLVAGPIERATNLLPQMLRARTLNYTHAVAGLRLMLWGFVKKMVVADTCAMAVDIIWQEPGQQSALVLAVGAFLFSMQIYGDFSGYSDIAVGCARLFGIQLMQNFRTPYFSTSISDFWRRWHISLMTWLRDYVYIPLGGNRCRPLRQHFNQLATFLLSGLWHGAAWTFVFWGVFHGLLVAVEKGLKSLHSNSLTPSTSPVREAIRALLVFFLVTFGWIIFRADSLGALADYLTGLCHLSTLTAFGTLTMGKTAVLWSLALLAVEWLQRDKECPLDLPSRGIFRLRLVRWTIYYALLALLLFCHGEQQTFIYFQF